MTTKDLDPTEKLAGYVTTKGAAELLGINEAKVVKLIQSGRVKARRFGWIWAIKAESLEELREAGLNGSGNVASD